MSIGSDIAVYRVIGLEDKDRDTVTLVPYFENENGTQDNASKDIVENEQPLKNEQNIEMKTPNDKITYDDNSQDDTDVANFPDIKQDINSQALFTHPTEIEDEETNNGSMDIKKNLKKLRGKIRNCSKNTIKKVIHFIKFLIKNTEINFELNLKQNIVLVDGVKIKLSLFVKFVTSKHIVKKKEFSKLKKVYSSLPTDVRKLIKKPKI